MRGNGGGLPAKQKNPERTGQDKSRNNGNGYRMHPTSPEKRGIALLYKLRACPAKVGRVSRPDKRQNKDLEQ
jgi:hypothetical protein